MYLTIFKTPFMMRLGFSGWGFFGSFFFFPNTTTEILLYYLKIKVETQHMLTYNV